MKTYTEIIEEIRNKIKVHEEAVKTMENEIVQAQKSLQEAIEAKQAAANSGAVSQYEQEAKKADYWNARLEALKKKVVAPAISYEEGVAYGQALDEAYRQAVLPLYNKLRELMLKEEEVLKQLDEIAKTSSGLPFIRIGSLNQGRATHTVSFSAYNLPQALIQHRNHAEYCMDIVTDKAL